jgi:N-acetyl-gamma-glutamyl-phosphate reductase
MRVKVGVIGASGYAGAELLRLLVGHPELDVVLAQAESAAGSQLGVLYPALGGAYRDLELGPVDPTAVGGLDAVFCCLPSGHAHKLVPQLLEYAALVVDLSADFRLKDPVAYEQWYGFEHASPELLAEAVYGLPELNREALTASPPPRLVAAPGCYVTAAALALAPLVGAGAIEPHGVIVDAASGLSGAGRHPSETTHFSAVNDGFSAYGLLTHRHTPEIEQVTGAEVLFTPHLAPMTRGILATCYARPSAGATATADPEDVVKQAYLGEPFVRIVDEPPSTRDTLASNNCHIAVRHDPRTGWVVVLSALDNLVKGAAGQALQAANAALGLPERLGLPLVGLVP